VTVGSGVSVGIGVSVKADVAEEVAVSVSGIGVADGTGVFVAGGMVAVGVGLLPQAVSVTAVANRDTVKLRGNVFIESLLKTLALHSVTGEQECIKL